MLDALIHCVTYRVPVYREFYEDWTINTFNRKHHECRNYLSPNRRGFYKILFITERMDDAFLGSIDVALQKAKTAMLLRMNSEEVGEFLEPTAAAYGW